VELESRDLETRHEQTPASMSGTPGITEDWTSDLSLAGGRNQLTFTPFGDKGSNRCFFDDFDYH
jgi:hypothetical protein